MQFKRKGKFIKNADYTLKYRSDNPNFLFLSDLLNHGVTVTEV